MKVEKLSFIQTVYVGVQHEAQVMVFFPPLFFSIEYLVFYSFADIAKWLKESEILFC